MKAETFLLLKDILIILFLLIGTSWMWGILKFGPGTQTRMEETFVRSRRRFKWMFLVALILITGAIIYRRFIV
ncbi:MAG: hypothetical protein H7Y00_04110 [Fimbriimonadaceae bacterium]|nr:hypothetical protein [Chitinophagales bacterium]